jgi:hypothetical protein
VAAIGSKTRAGSRPSRRPFICAGQPAVVRRTMCGGVRIARLTDSAPPSARSVAISAPLLPGPTTSTVFPRNGEALR